MKHLNCIVYIKPDSIDTLANELLLPHFNEYHVFFNNIVSKNQLERLAESDRFEVISSVIELFQDFWAVTNNLFQLPIQGDSIIDETSKLLSVLLSVKKFPIIQSEGNSIALKKLSSEVLYQINSNLNNNLFESFSAETPPILVLMDRFNDPVTPLLHPWTYQAMIHELIGIDRNIVLINKEKIVLSDRADDFFNLSVYMNYGDLTESFQKRVDAFKKESNTNIQTKDLMELKKVLTRLPEFQKKSSNIVKHLNILSELDSKIKSKNLWEISELQQTIICKLDNQNAIDNNLIRVITMDSVSTDEKVKLLLLYSVQFGSISKFLNLIPDLSIAQLKLLNNFVKKFNNITHLFKKKEPENNFKRFLNNFSNANEIDNVYLQYTPPLKETLTRIINGQLDFNTLVPDTLTESPVVQDVIVYFKNGITYEEARIVEEFNKDGKIRVLVGSDKVLNSHQWLEELYNWIE